MPRAGPRRVQRCALQLKLTAVTLSQSPGVEVRSVPEALEPESREHPAALDGSDRAAERRSLADSVPGRIIGRRNA